MSVSGAKSDAADAHMLADMVRTDAHQLRPVAGDSPQAEAIKGVSEKTLDGARRELPAGVAPAAGDPRRLPGRPAERLT